MPLDIAAMNVGANTADLFVNSAEELEGVDIQIYGKKNAIKYIAVNLF